MIKKNNFFTKDTNIKKRLNELTKIIHKHNILYHEKDNPEISDRDFDSLIKEYNEIEKNFPHLTKNKGPNKSIGIKISSKFKKYAHKKRMLSLSNAFSEKDLIDFIERIKKLQPEYDKKSKLFHSQKEVEGLYQNISDFASTNSLNIINLNKENPVPITSGKKKKNVAYFKIPVSYEISGNYLGYLKFRRALAKSNKVINFDREQITVVQGTGIKSVGTLSIVGLPDEYKK